MQDAPKIPLFPVLSKDEELVNAIFNHEMTKVTVHMDYEAFKELPKETYRQGMQNTTNVRAIYHRQHKEDPSKFRTFVLIQGGKNE